MNIELSPHIPTCHYKRIGEKLIFVPCPPESKCYNLDQEIDDTKKLIFGFLNSNSSNHQQEALLLSEKILEKCEQIKNHETTCQIIQYKSLLARLYYYLYDYHINGKNKNWLKQECNKIFDIQFKNISDK